MSLISDVLKTAVPVLGPTLGLANAAVRIGTAASVGPLGGATLAIGIIAEECVPPAVYVSGKCVTAFACYVGGTLTCNPIWFGAGTTILTSIL
jgi:hypothetical protein